MSTPDSLAAVAAAVKDTVLDSVHAASQTSIVQDSVAAVSQAIASKGPTTGDLITQMGLFQFMMIIAAFGAVAAFCYLAMAFHRIAAVLESGVSIGSSTQTAVAPATTTPSTVVSVPDSAPIHPGLSDEKLAVLLAVAAAEIMGKQVNVVKFRSAGNTEWTWAHQGRVELNTRRL